MPCIREYIRDRWHHCLGHVQGRMLEIGDTTVWIRYTGGCQIGGTTLWVMYKGGCQIGGTTLWVIYKGGCQIGGTILWVITREMLDRSHHCLGYIQRRMSEIGSNFSNMWTPRRNILFHK